MTARRHRVHLRRPAVVALAVVAMLCWLGDAAAGMYTWVDDQGDRHLVDSREKVPQKYRTRARELSADEPRAQPGAGRENQRSPQPETASGTSNRGSDEAPAAESRRPGSRASDASPIGWLDRVRAKWALGVPRLPAVHDVLTSWLPRDRLARFAATVLGAALVLRGLSALTALRGARRLSHFGASYRQFLAHHGERVAPAMLEALEHDLPEVHRWSRAARLGPTTIGASREVGMGRVMDEGRVDVIRSSLERPDLVGAHALVVVARAEGVHRHRARRWLTPLGWLETLAFWPRYLVWRRADDSEGGVRVLLSLYWLVVLLFALAQ